MQKSFVHSVPLAAKLGCLTLGQVGGDRRRDKRAKVFGHASSQLIEKIAVTDLKIEASGGSDFSGYDLITENCIIQASGGSDIQITVNKEIYAEASGASDVNWKGKAAVKGVHASGSGSVSHRS